MIVLSAFAVPVETALPWNVQGELLADIEVKKAKKEEELAKKKQEAILSGFATFACSWPFF